jgi:hypothetical protein
MLCGVFGKLPGILEQDHAFGGRELFFYCKTASGVLLDPCRELVLDYGTSSICKIIVAHHELGIIRPTKGIRSGKHTSSPLEDKNGNCTLDPSKLCTQMAQTPMSPTSVALAHLSLSSHLWLYEVSL